MCERTRACTVEYTKIARSQEQWVLRSSFFRRSVSREQLNFARSRAVAGGRKVRSKFNIQHSKFVTTKDVPCGTRQSSVREKLKTKGVPLIKTRYSIFVRARRSHCRRRDFYSEYRALGVLYSTQRGVARKALLRKVLLHVRTPSTPERDLFHTQLSHELSPSREICKTCRRPHVRGSARFYKYDGTDHSRLQAHA